jgi:tripeptide aminopeptidase
MEIDKKRLLDTFINIVKIDSESGYEREMISYLEQEMNALSFKTEVDKIGNLICSNSNNPKLLLAAHVDTVTPGKNIRPIIKDNLIKTDGSTILGTDDKANVSAILEILKVLKENNNQAPIEVVFTIGEEIGLIGSKNLDYSRIKSTQGLNLDGEAGEIDIAEPSMMFFDIEITGRAAHSGMEPEKGISAIRIAAEAICVLDLGRIDDETTANIGIIQGGTAINTIPEKVIIKAEIRSRNEEKFNYQVNKLVTAFEQASKRYGGSVKIESKKTSQAYRISETDDLVQTLKQNFIKNEIKPDILEITAASDANNFQKNGIKCVTTGTFGKKYHTTQEYLEIDKFILATSSILDTIIELTK